jgi:hypothetical protein
MRTVFTQFNALLTCKLSSFVYSIVLILPLISCHSRVVPHTVDWWKHATNKQIEDIAYRTFCSPEPTSCLPKSDYKTSITKQPELNFFVIGFEHLKDNKMSSISCYNRPQALKLNCQGSNRRGAVGLLPGTESGRDYPIIWD